MHTTVDARSSWKGPKLGDRQTPRPWTKQGTTKLHRSFALAEPVAPCLLAGSGVVRLTESLLKQLGQLFDTNPSTKLLTARHPRVFFSADEHDGQCPL